MLARCAHCQKIFTAERFGVQRCPHCGWEVLLQDPSAPPAPSPAPTPPAPSSTPAGGQPVWGGPPPPLPAQTPPPGPPSATPPPGATPPWAGAPPPWTTPPPWPQPWGGAPQWPAPAGWAPLPPGMPLPPPGGDGESAPFAHRRTSGLLAAFGRTWKLVALEPRRFFRFVRVDESASAVLFGVASFSIGTWISLVFAALAGGASTAAMHELLRRLPPGTLDPDVVAEMLESTGRRAILGQAVMTPLFALFVIYLVAGIVHVLLLLVRGGSRRFQATLTVVGYAYGLSLLLALPVCGYPVALFWIAYTLVVGVGEAQRCGPGRAAFAVFAPVVLACLMSCVTGALVAYQYRGGIPTQGTGL